MGEQPARPAGSRAKARGAKTSSQKAASNRKNAKRSTGPRTALGKSRSRLNALKHGILASIAVNEVLEGRSERNLFDQMVDGLANELNPVGWREELLVQEIANCYWNKRKLLQYEQDLAFERHQDIIAKNQEIDQINAFVPPERAPVHPTYVFARVGQGPGIGIAGEARENAGLEIPTLPHPHALAIITRYRTALSRERERLMKELDQLQAKRLGAEGGAALHPEPARGGIDPGIGLRNNHRNCQPLSIATTMRFREMELEQIAENAKASYAAKQKTQATPADDTSPVEPTPEQRDKSQNYETKPKIPRESDTLPALDSPESASRAAGDGEKGPDSTSSG